MRAGTLRHLITIQQNTPTKAADNSLVDSWSSFAADVPAEIRTEGGREFWRQRQMNSELTHEITIRYRTGVKPNMQVVWGARTLQITAVINDDAKRTWTRLMCRESNG